MKFVGRLSLLTTVSLAALTSTNGYEIGCLYPAGMPDPVTAHVTMLQYLALVQQRDKVETPIVIHGGLLSGLCGATCLAVHDPKALYPFTMMRPMLQVPEFGHNAHSIAMCNLQCHAVLVGLDVMKPLLDKWGIDMPNLFHPDLEFLSRLRWKENAREATAQEMLQALQVIQEHDYHPFLVGQAVIMSIYKDYVNIDGWNNLGNFTYDPISKEVVPCEYNCMPYSDLSGYHPRNNPGQSEITEENKYNVTGNDMYWQPLLEDDGFGYFSRQQHVVPHVINAKSVGNPNLRDKTLPSPNYEYYAEALKVVEELRLTASNKTRQVQIDFFDNKVDVVGLIKHEIQEQFSDLHSYQRRIMFGFGMLLAEDDGVVLAWTEKVKHDLVRPTTVIQRWGSDLLTTYGGDRSIMEAVEIPARNFEAFVRVMPHAEYPSGSSCLCTIFREYTDGYTQKYYGGKKIDGLHYGPEGHSVNCGGHIDPSLPQGLACNDESYVFTLKDMSELEHICGESRLWGGMHFTKSVPAGSELCTGIGEFTVNFIDQMMDGTDFGGNEWFVGDSARPPKCSDPSKDQTGSKFGFPMESDGDMPEYFDSGATAVGSSIAVLLTVVASLMMSLSLA